MFIQQSNGYYYLTEKRCGQIAKVYLWNQKQYDKIEEGKLFITLKDKIIKSEKYLHFIDCIGERYNLSVQNILQRIFVNYTLKKYEMFSSYLTDKFIQDFVYHSNKSEWSRIAYDDFIKIVKKEKPITTNRNEIQEVKNSFLAREFLMNGFVRNEANIKKLHKILTTWLIGEDGKPYQTWYKKYNNLVGNALTTDYMQVSESMKSLLSRYQKNKKILFPLHLAFEFHYRFERIHPFADGNGRIGRLLMNKILYDHQCAPLTIFSENRTAYFRAFEKSIEKWSQVLYIFLIEQYKKTLNS